MHADVLARIQFALTIGFHYIFPPLTIGMAWIIFIMQSLYLKTGDDLLHKISKFWIKLFGITFAVGVATGITMEFQFGTNWAAYSRFVGDIFGAPLAAEGILAFFLESSFLAVMLYGEKKVSKKTYWLSSFMVAFGATMSAFWIIVANSWQQTPQGFKIENGRAILTDFWAAVFNPSTMPRFFHTTTGALVAGAFFITGISAYYLRKKQHLPLAKKSLLISLIFAFVASSAVGMMGHLSSVEVAKYQPTKLAAFEGLWETEKSAPLLIFGIPDPDDEKTHYAMRIPGLLSLLVSGNLNYELRGLKEFPKEDRPPVLLSFISFHLMVALGMFFILLTGFGLILWWRGNLFENELFLKILMWSTPLPIIANEIGWISAEVGRQPWIVQGVMRTRDAISTSVPAEQILISIIMFTIIYAVLFGAWIYLLSFQIKKGPAV